MCWPWCNLDTPPIELQAWFVDESTRMNPHMRFAQLRMGHKKDIDNGGFQSGIIETKVRILSHAASSLLSS
jgi:hypothetical protein